MNMIALITTYTLKTTTIAMKTIRIGTLTTDSMTMVLTEFQRKFLPLHYGSNKCSINRSVTMIKGHAWLLIIFPQTRFLFDPDLDPDL